MSYVVQLSDGYRLFALNDDTNKNGKSGFSDECFEWITAEAERARRDGQMIIAMTHHPLIAPSPIYAMIGKGDMLGDYEARIEQLADIGVSFISRVIPTFTISRIIAARGATVSMIFAPARR